jgi:hypothetical protein
LKREHEVVVVSKLGLELDSLEHLVGVGRMTSQRVTSMGAACIASAGAGMRTGTAAAMTTTRSFRTSAGFGCPGEA